MPPSFEDCIFLQYQPCKSILEGVIKPCYHLEFPFGYLKKEPVKARWRSLQQMLMSLISNHKLVLL